MAKSNKGIVYILTNPCMPDWVKIGMTERDDIKKRLSELNAPPNMPLMFRAYALYRVENPREVEKNIHTIIDNVDESLHAREEVHGRIREREFFQMSPERAYQIIQSIAHLRGDIDSLELVVASMEEEQEDRIARLRRPPFKFSMAAIPAGSTIRFLRDDSITATTVDDGNKVLFNGQEYSTSALAALLLDRVDGSFCGPEWFTFNGELLSERRARIEASNE